MIQSIINGIIRALRTEYNESFRIYTESTEQGLIEPCFSVLSINPSSEREVGNRYKRRFLFNITYFPATDEPISECNEVCETLLGLLNDVETDIGIIHSVDIPEGKIVDGNLQFTIQYQVFARLVEAPTETMQELSVDTATV